MKLRDLLEDLNYEILNEGPAGLDTDVADIVLDSRKTEPGILFTCIKPRKAPTLITDIAKCSFGMYLMHLFFLGPIAGMLIAGDVANPLLPVGICIPVIAVLTFVVCYAVAKLLSYIPGHEYFVG